MPAGPVFHDRGCQSQTHEGSPSAVLNTEEWTVEWTVEWKEVRRASRGWRRPSSSAGVEAEQIASSHRTWQAPEEHDPKRSRVCVPFPARLRVVADGDWEGDRRNSADRNRPRGWAMTGLRRHTGPRGADSSPAALRDVMLPPNREIGDGEGRTDSDSGGDGGPDPDPDRDAGQWR